MEFLWERKLVTASFVGGSAGFFFYEEPRSKGQLKFKLLPDIPAITGDGIAYGVACLQFLDSSLEGWHFVKVIVLLGTQFFQQCKVLLTKIFVFAVWC